MTIKIRLKAKQDAPNYRNAGPSSTQICSTCRFANGRTCNRYSFGFEAGYVCDAWRPNIEAVRARMAEIRKQEKAYGYASTQFDMPAVVMGKVLTFAAEIDADDLTEQGVERDTHVTIKYGLRNDALRHVAEIAEAFAPIRLTFGEVTLFERDEFDVVKVEVESEELHQLNALLSLLPNGDIHPVYNPHMTIAYVKAGMGKKYVGPGPVKGMSVVVDTIKYSTSNGQKTSISLRGEQDPSPSLNVFKDRRGDWRWTAVSSTAFKDRDGEIVSTASLKEAVEINDATGEHGPLRWWHMKSVDLGDCDFSMLYGRMLIESGTFHNDLIAMKVAREAPNLELSIGFKHPVSQPDTNGVYENIKIFERSLIPAGRASNKFTKLTVKGESNMSTDLVKVSGLVALLGEGEALKVLQNAANTQQTAENTGHQFKSSDDPADMSDWTAEDFINHGEAMKVAEAKAKADEEAQKAKESDTVIEFDADAFVASLKEVVGDAVAEAVATATAETSKAADERVQALEAQIAKTTKELAELKGEQPRAMKSGYRASQQGEEVNDSQATEKSAEEIEKQKALQANPEIAPFYDVAQSFGNAFPTHPHWGGPPQPSNTQ